MRKKTSPSKKEIRYLFQAVRGGDIGTINLYFKNGGVYDIVYKGESLIYYAARFKQHKVLNALRWHRANA